jgi:hypothetical protein
MELPPLDSKGERNDHGLFHWAKPDSACERGMEKVMKEWFLLPWGALFQSRKLARSSPGLLPAPFCKKKKSFWDDLVARALRLIQRANG